ncbi:hypothetical protein OTU49_007906 [Cherax quadricarinatus]|uniref:Uncharacterized protein n=1 Tax=Cherax quadricarinatus TaxID=27406 RepID=A0AAW0WEY6_CHEQU
MQYLSYVRMNLINKISSNKGLISPCVFRSSPTKHAQTQGQQQASVSRPTVSFAHLTPSHSRSGASVSNIGGTSGMSSTALGSEEGTAVNMHSMLIPPMRDLHTSAPSSTNGNNVTTTTTTSSSNNTIALTLHITSTTNTTSPARTNRGNDKGRKSPVSIWGASLKNRGQGLCIQGQGQASGQGQSHWEDDDHFGFGLTLDGPPSIISGIRHHTSDLSRSSDTSRTMDLSRHPYTISLDRTKELVAREPRENTTNRDTHVREYTRDPLKEIKDNPRDPLGHRDLRDSTRRPKLEVMGWAKPRLLNDDLSLPNVPGVSSAVNTGSSSSPKKNGSESVGHIRSRRAAGVTMPSLGNLHRSSANSIESSSPSPLANLPYV